MHKGYTHIPMEAPRKRLRSFLPPPRLLKALGITVLAFTLSTMLMRPFSFSASAFLSNPEKSDFAITDFYSIVADSRPVRQIDDQIVIININGLDRDGIASVLHLMPLLQPAAVGLDVAFIEPREDDTRLLAAIKACPNLVLPVSLAHDTDSDSFTIAETSFFSDSTAADIPVGATNLPARYAKSTIREFQTYFPLKDTAGKCNDPVPSFVVAIAGKGRPSMMEALEKRGNRIELINYPSRSFRIFTPEEIADNAHLIAGRIILIGDTGDLADMHATPVTSTMSGVMIHAYALATIVHHEYLDSFSKTENLALAFALCLVVVLTSVMLPIGIKGLIMRIMQVSLLYFVVRLGYTLFLDHNLVIDFSYALLMLAFGLLACDIWIGMTTIINIILSKLRDIRKTSYSKI